MLTRKEFHQACKELFEKVKTNKVCKTEAICCNLYMLTYPTSQWDEIAYAVKNYSKNWNKHSGDDNFPVPGGKKLYVLSSNNFWQGKYGKDRVELLKYLIRNSR